MEPRREIRLVTSVFIDVVGSTDATVRLGPERMQRMLADAFAAMSSIIAAEGGVTEKYIGDAVFAIFGAPVAHADDAERALRAAERCVGWTAGMDGSGHGTGLAVRIGVETGEVLVDLAALDTRQRMVVGEPVNIAARLQQHAAPGEIVVGPVCHAATASAAEYEPLGQLELKGLAAVDAWRFRGFSSTDTAAQVAFVGRNPELALLGDAYATVKGGKAVLVLVVGPPGQGKSRLAAEALSRSRDAALLRARCRPGTENGLNVPLRQLLDPSDADLSADAIRRRVTQLLGPEDGPRVATALAHAAGVEPDDDLLATNRWEQREIIAAAWRAYLAALAREGPVIALIEDVHWADPTLVRVMDHVTTDLAAPVLVVATARPEFAGTAHMGPGKDRVEINLGPLDEAAVRELAMAAGGTELGATDAAARAAGNPLFVIELARAQSRPSELPVTVQAAIATRLDELADDERDLLQRVSVAGESFDLRGAALLGDREPGEISAALGRFEHLGFIGREAARYRFQHALFREVAYSRLPIADRMALHARYASHGVDPADVETSAYQWWEALKSPDADWVWTDAPRLASMRHQAFAVHLAAGKRLEERNAYEEALAVYQHAVELSEDGAERAAAQAAVGRGFAKQGAGDDAWEHRRRAIDLYSSAGLPVPAGLYADMLEMTAFNWGYFHNLPADHDVVGLLADGERRARDSGDEVSLARLLAERGAYTEDASGAEEVGRLLERPDAIDFADAAQRMATVCTWVGRTAEARSMFGTVFERLIPAGASVNAPEAMVWYGLASFNAGELAEAAALARELQVEAMRRSIHTQSHAFGLSALVQFGRGDWAALAQSVDELRVLIERNPETAFCLVGGSALGCQFAADVLAGRPLPPTVDEEATRMVEVSDVVRASCLLLAKVMAGDASAIGAAQGGYADGLRLADRSRVWDVFDLNPAISLTMTGQWDRLGPILERMDRLADRGTGLAAAVASAIREEAEAAEGGPAPEHGELHRLGYEGISQLLQFRPTDKTAGSA